MTQTNGSEETVRSSGAARMVVAAALAAGMWAPAHAQDVETAPEDTGGAAAKDADLAAETAYLKAYFAERELRDLVRAQKEYEAVTAMKGASHDVVARAWMGFQRCARASGAVALADSTLDKLSKEFADVKDVAEEVARVRASLAPRAGTARIATEQEIAIQDPELARLMEQKALLERDLRTKENQEKLGSKHPAVVEKRNDLVAVERRIMARVNAWRAAAAQAPAAALENRIAAALSESQPASAISPFGDRAVPILEREVRGSDDPRRVGIAADVLVKIDTAMSRETVRAVAAAPDLPFPSEFARAVAGSQAPTDAVALLRTMPSTTARRAGYGVLIGRSTDDAVVAAILADREARPPFAKTSLSSHGGVRLLLAGLASKDDGDRKEAAEAIARATVTPGALNYDASLLRVWFSASPESLADPAVRSLLIENVYARGQMQGDVGASPSLLRVIASHPLGARAVLMYYTNPQQASPPSSWDREALRLAIAGTQHGAQGVQPYNNLPRVLDAVGMANAEDLGFLASHWNYLTDFRGLVLQPLTTLKRVDGALTTALLDPSHRPEVLQSCCAWIQSAPDTLDVAPEVSRAVARLVAHPAGTVRAGAALALRSLAMQKRLDPGIDPLPLVEALGTISDANASQALVAAVQALPPESRARLLPTFTPQSPRALTLVSLIADLPGDEVDRKLESLISGAGTTDVAQAAATALAKRLKERIEPVFERILREGPDPARAAVLSTVALSAGGPVPFDVAERLLLLGFETAPGSLNLAPPGSPFLARLTHMFPTETRRRLSRGALRSKSEKDRRWGASTLGTLGDDAAWDDLLVVAEDPDPDARGFARAALRAIEDARTDMEALRSVTEMRKVHGRLAGLLASKDSMQRRAGIAAIVALGSRDWIGELVRLASDDPAAEIQSAACDALVALGAQVPARKAEAAPAGEKR